MAPKQRHLVKMTPEEVLRFLHEERVMTVSTHNHDGTIHSVAMWYGFLDDAVVFSTRPKSQKALNLRRNPQLTCLVEAGDNYASLRGVEIVGEAEFLEDPADRSAAMHATHDRYATDPGSARTDQELARSVSSRLIVRVRAQRIASWDHRKLSGALPAV